MFAKQTQVNEQRKIAKKSSEDGKKGLSQKDVTGRQIEWEIIENLWSNGKQRKGHISGYLSWRLLINEQYDK